VNEYDKPKSWTNQEEEADDHQLSYPPNPNGRYQAVSFDPAMSDTEQLVRMTVLDSVSVGEQSTIPVPEALELEEQYEGNASCEDAT